MVFRPPEEIDAGAVILRRVRLADLDAVAPAVARSCEHLEPWMPWARASSTPAGDEVLGTSGIHCRVGPGAVEIGYWVHVDHVRRGYATAVARPGEKAKPGKRWPGPGSAAAPVRP